jgi:hypothetical protein
MAQLRGRRVKNKIFAIRMEQPEVDFATIAKAFGIWSRVPIGASPETWGRSLASLKVVKDGKPALVDAVCEMRR